MKILAVKSHTKTIDGRKRVSAVDWWRTVSPLQKVAEKTGWKVDFVDEIKDFSIVKDYDLVWSSYFTNILGYKALIDSGVHTVIDFDDDFLHLMPGNPVRREFAKNSLAYRNIEFMIRHVPNMVVSTEHLSRVYGKIRSYEEQPFVLENRINTSYRPVKLKWKATTPVCIGWMGGATHYTDLFHTAFWGALTYLTGKYPTLEFRVMGLYPDADYKDLPNFYWEDGSVDHPTFTEKLRKWMRDVDICVAPLEDTLFNASKSSIKVQEYGIFGKPVVAANVRPYQEFHADSNGLITLAETHGEWVQALERLIIDRGVRHREGKKLAEFIETSYTIDTVVDKYIEYINYVTENGEYPRQEARQMLKNGSLSIVLGCRRFETTTGSELYYYELAREYLEMGHKVTVVAQNIGDPLLRKIINLGGEVLNISDADTLQPDLIIASHEITAELLQMFTVPVIQVIHSENDYLWEIEKPVRGCVAYVAVRESIREKVIQSGIHPDKVHTILNPIDLSRFKPTGTRYKELLFVGPKDVLREKIIEDVKKVAKQKGLKPVFIGQDQDIEPTWEIEKYTKRCEMTASAYVGRTTLEGWACNKAGLVYQIDAQGNIESKTIIAPQDSSQFDSKLVAQRILSLC